MNSSPIQAYEKCENALWGYPEVSRNDLTFPGLRIRYACDALTHRTGAMLDIGCGAGRMLRAIKRHSPTLIFHGCDIQSKAIQKARESNGIKNYIVASATDLPYKDRSFDIITAFDVLENIHDLDKTLNEIYRVLKQNGISHIFVPCESNPLTLYNMTWKLLGTDLKSGHVQKLTTKKLINLLRKSGFAVTKINYSYHIIGQIGDILSYCLMRALGPQKTKFRSSADKGKPKHSLVSVNILVTCGSKLLYPLYRVWRVISYFESVILRRVYGNGTHITLRKTDDRLTAGTGL